MDVRPAIGNVAGKVQAVHCAWHIGISELDGDVIAGLPPVALAATQERNLPARQA